MGVLNQYCSQQGCSGYCNRSMMANIKFILVLLFLVCALTQAKPAKKSAEKDASEDKSGWYGRKDAKEDKSGWYGKKDTKEEKSGWYGKKDVSAEAMSAVL